MFLFIVGSSKLAGLFLDLNTSHVLIYLGSSTASPCCQTDLNTSHVLIYRCWWGWNVYQSCHLNTSHVLIYLIDSLIKFPSPQFKYISCSYLSICGGNDNPNIFQFKYISCSYLSKKVWNVKDCCYEFKYISCSYLSNVFTHFLFSIISYIALFFNISQLFYQPPPHFSFSSSLVSFPLIL